MEHKTVWHVVPWKRNGSSYWFDDEKQARAKHQEMSKNLKSDERLEVYMEEIEKTELEWKPTPPVTEEK